MFATTRSPISTGFAVLAALGLCSTGALAHLQMQNPLPIDSPLGSGQPKNGQSYSYTAPLSLDGSEYPCKGSAYLSDPSLLRPRATWSAGSTQSFTIAPPGAIHGGGSCQLALSYDMGKTWNVIWSYIGGCMAEDLTQSFTLPAEAPSGQALFAWNWFNRVGNREMYQNCAVIDIANGGSGLNANDYPAPFVANAGVNSCATTEGTDPVFPNPGKAVKYGGSYAGSQPTSGAGITGSNCGHPGGTGSGGSGGSSGGSGGSPAPAPSSDPAPAPSSSTRQAPAPSSSAAGAPVYPPPSSTTRAPVGAPEATRPAASSTASTTTRLGTEYNTPPKQGGKGRVCKRWKSGKPASFVPAGSAKKRSTTTPRSRSHAKVHARRGHGGRLGGSF